MIPALKKRIRYRIRSIYIYIASVTVTLRNGVSNGSNGVTIPEPGTAREGEKDGNALLPLSLFNACFGCFFFPVSNFYQSGHG